MPWKVKKVEGEFCVFDKDGKKLKCYKTTKEANDYKKALYANANENLEELKTIALESDPVIVGIAATNIPHLPLPPMSVVEVNGETKVRVPFLRKGIFRHPNGNLIFDTNLFNKVLENHKAKKSHYGVSLNEKHKPGAALAWFDEERDGYITQETDVKYGDILVAYGKPTSDKVVEMINNREYVFASVELSPNYKSNMLARLSGDDLEEIQLDDLVMLYNPNHDRLGKFSAAVGIAGAASTTIGAIASMYGTTKAGNDNKLLKAAIKQKAKGVTEITKTDWRGNTTTITMDEEIDGLRKTIKASKELKDVGNAMIFGGAVAMGAGAAGISISDNLKKQEAIKDNIDYVFNGKKRASNAKQAWEDDSERAKKQRRASEEAWKRNEERRRKAQDTKTTNASSWPEGTTEKDFQRMYRKAAQAWHPDINKAPDAEETMKKVNNLYDNMDWKGLKDIVDKLEDSNDDLMKDAITQFSTFITALKVAFNMKNADFMTIPDDGSDTEDIFVKKDGNFIIDKVTGKMLIERGDEIIKALLGKESSKLEEKMDEVTVTLEEYEGLQAKAELADSIVGLEEQLREKDVKVTELEQKLMELETPVAPEFPEEIRIKLEAQEKEIVRLKKDALETQVNLVITRAEAYRDSNGNGHSPVMLEIARNAMLGNAVNLSEDKVIKLESGKPADVADYFRKIFVHMLEVVPGTVKLEGKTVADEVVSFERGASFTDDDYKSFWADSL